jgi:hypothetical protein
MWGPAQVSSLLWLSQLRVTECPQVGLTVEKTSVSPGLLAPSQLAWRLFLHTFKLVPALLQALVTLSASRTSVVVTLGHSTLVLCQHEVSLSLGPGSS